MRLLSYFSISRFALAGNLKMKDYYTLLSVDMANSMKKKGKSKTPKREVEASQKSFERMISLVF